MEQEKSHQEQKVFDCEHDHRTPLSTRIKMIIFLIWDGLGFFGFDDNKLQRLRGIPVRWNDRFKNKRWMLYQSVGLFIIFAILVNEFRKIGDVKN